MKLRIGHLSTFYHTAILLMADSRYSCTDAYWRLFGTGPAIVAAFEKGELDIAYIGLPPAIIGMERGVPITCVAGGHIEGTVISGPKQGVGFPDTYDLGIIMKQFSGLKIGVPGRGSIHDVILKDCLERYNLLETVEVLNFAWADQVMEAMVKGRVAAAVGTPALAVAVARYADAKILYPPSLLWPANPSYGILADTRILKQERGTVEDFLKRHEEATAFMRARPGEAAALISSYIGVVDADFVLDTLKVSPKYCAQLTEEYIGSTMKFVRSMKKLGYIRRELAGDEIFDTSLMREIHGGSHHYEDGIADER